MRNNVNSACAVNSDGKYIFISYSSKDSEIVKKDCAELVRHDVPFWIDDKLVAGFDWRYAIKKIRSSDCAGVIFYISENSITSKPVMKELRAAVQRFGKPLPIDKDSKERVEGYFSINIGGKAPSEMRNDMRATGDRARVGRGFLRHFNKNVIYITRDVVADNMGHLLKMLDVLELYDIMIPGVCDSLKYEQCPNGIMITGYVGSSKHITVPEMIVGQKVIMIANDAFKMNSVAESVIIPDTVTYIGEGAFRGMTGLASIRLPKMLTHLGEAAFRDTKSLKSVDLPGGLKVLNQAMFKGSGIESLCVPNGIEEFGEAIFSDCSNLKTLVIPPTVRQMTEGGFRGCVSLKQLTIPNNIQGLNADSFSDSPSIDVIIGERHYHDGISEPRTH